MFKGTTFDRRHYFSCLDCQAEVYVSTTDLFTPGYTINQQYPDLLTCEFVIISKNADQPLSIVFNSDFVIKAKDSMKVHEFAK